MGKRILFRRVALALLPGVLIVSGCASNAGPAPTAKRDVHQFDPLPRSTAASSDLDPVEQRSVTALLHEAEAAFARANAAQEKGDKPGALEHYNRMLELLLEADLDPAVFYDLRREFGSIIDESQQHARLLDRRRPGAFPQGKWALGGVELPDPLPGRVMAELDRIQFGYAKSFQYGLNQGAHYLPEIERKLTAAGLPKELAWVAMIESHFTPKIVSRAGAGGMWQFIPSTGKRYGLRVDGYVDERYDWQRSTDAAIAYLTDLYEMFGGDWALALSAYNMGEGGVQRILDAAGGETDWWALMDHPVAGGMIPEETKQYYAKFLASMIAASDPAAYGFSMPAGTVEDTLRAPVGGIYALDQLDGALGLAGGTLTRLNPHLVRGVTPAGGYDLVMPGEAQPKLSAALEQVKQVKAPAPATTGGAPAKARLHKVKRGETVASIARKYGVDQKDLMKTNKIKTASALKAGQTLKVPGAAAKENAAPDAKEAMAEAKPKAAPAKSHTVKPGDTLHEIAGHYGCTVADLRAWNGIEGHAIRAGQKLTVKTGTADAPAEMARAAARETPAAAEYVVKQGDAPGKIAKAHGMSTDAFLALNGMDRDATIRVGQKVKVQAGGMQTAKAASAGSGKEEDAGKKVIHKVAAGDTASGIARQYGVSLDDFLAWNGLKPSSVLREGQQHVLYVPASYAAGSSEAEPESARDAGDGEPLGGDLPAGAADEDGKRMSHTVTKGQNPSSIARKLGVKSGDLYRWNNWPKDHVLHVGDSVVYFK